MTKRKPAHVGFDSWIEAQIHEARARGDLDDLPGAGKPLPGVKGPHDEHWWLKGLLAREDLSAEALLPEPIKLRKEIDRLPAVVAGLADENAVREVVEKLNERILLWHRSSGGPNIHVGLVDVDDVLALWSAHEPGPAADPAPARTEPARPKRRWWHRGH